MPTSPSSAPCILIVEDSLTQAAQLRFMLEENGFAVAFGRNGREALSLLATLTPLAVISDINMPEMDGYELCRQLRADARWAALPVILLTSLSKPADVLFALACGADYFFTKPLNEDLMVTRLRYLLEEQHLDRSPADCSTITVQTQDGRHHIAASHTRTLNLLLSTYESAVAQNQKLQHVEAELRQLNENLEARVAQRTEELQRANAALQAENVARRTVELRLREQAELLDKANEVIITADLDRGIRFWNRGAERLLGRPAAEVLGESVAVMFSAVAGEAAGRRPAPFAELVDWRGEVYARGRDGATLTLEMSVTVLRNEQGMPTGWLSISTDITEKKSLQETILRVQRLESIGMLAAGIAHDLNNVLAPIGMVSTLLRHRLTAPGDLRFLDMLEGSVNRGAGLVRQIVGFAHGIGGERRIVQVKHLVRDIAAVVAQTFPKSVVLEEHVERELWPVNGQPTQIHQVLLNLCVNARDAMPKGGTLRLQADNVTLDEAEAARLADARPGKWIVLHVEDSGTGIAPDVLARIWEPFFTTKAAEKGTGLGLATVRGIVESHQGFITVDTQVGRGTTFRVHLPADPSGTESDPEKAVSVGQGSNELILVVDDEEYSRETTKEILSAAGYRVVCATNGVEAAAVLATRGGEVALVITDFDMPMMDGEGLIAFLRAHKPQQRVLLLSGDDRSRAVECTARLAKPCTVSTLLREVQRLLPAAAAAD